eukprot:m51a1_g5055 hypothetical protein (101) ;mRNA; r:92860-94673
MQWGIKTPPDDPLVRPGLAIDRDFWSLVYFVCWWKRGDDIRARSMAPNTDPLVDNLRERILQLRMPVIVLASIAPEAIESVVALVDVGNIAVTTASASTR